MAGCCDHVCPMRLKPRNIKRLMFACTQCGQCIAACATVQRDHPEGSLLNWIADQQALQADGAQGLLASGPVAEKSKATVKPSSLASTPVNVPVELLHGRM